VGGDEGCMAIRRFIRSRVHEDEELDVMGSSRMQQWIHRSVRYSVAVLTKTVRSDVHSRKDCFLGVQRIPHVHT
jgi:hypothetical protein